MDGSVVLILLIIVVVVVILIMKNIENSKKMKDLKTAMIARSTLTDTEIASIRKDVIQPTVVAPIINKIEQDEDIETVGDQSLALDEDPTIEYDEMANDAGIVKIAPPQMDNSWTESRQVEPVKDLSVGIAITNDVSKKEILQTGKTSSKYPIKNGTGVRAECADGKCGDPSKYPAQRQMGSIRRMDGTHSNMEAVRIAARNAAQKRDSDVKRVLDEKIQSQAKYAAMKRQQYVDTSKIKQYDVRPLKAPSAKLFRPTVMPPGDEMVGSLSERNGITTAKMKADLERMIAKNMKADDDARKASQNASMKAMIHVKSPIRKISKDIDVATSIEARNIAKKLAMENAIKLEQADIKSLNETGFTVKEAQKRAAMKIQQVAQDAREAAEQREKEEKMKNVMKAQQVAMKAQQVAMKAQQAAEQREKEEMEAAQAAMKAQQVAMKAQQAAEQREKEEMEAAQAAMKAQQAAEQGEKEEMEAVQAAMKAAVMNVEGYELMKPWGSMVY